MDVTPQVINEVEFHQKMRGYDPDEVDDFLERVAVAVGQLQERLDEAADRMAGAERRAAELESRLKEALSRPAAASAPAAASSPSVEEEAETIRRTLVLAQRTADAAIKEAEETAQRTVTAAQEQATQLYRESQERSRQLVEEAETEAKRAGEESRQRLVTEIIALEESRDALRADSGILERHLDEQRLRLRSSVAELQRLLDDPARLRVAPLPPLSEVSRPAAVADALADVEPEPAIASAASEAESFEPPGDDLFATAADEPAPATAGLDDDVVDRGVVDRGAVGDDVNGRGDSAWGAPAEPVIDLDAPITGGVTFTAPDEPQDDLGFATASPHEEEAWARFVGDDGPPTQSLDLGGDDDAYLAELRKAMVDDGGDLYDGDPVEVDDRQRSRFGRRR